MIVLLGRAGPISCDIVPSGSGDLLTLVTCFRHRLPTQRRRDQRNIVRPGRCRLSREIRDSANKNTGGNGERNVRSTLRFRGHESKGKDITILSFRISCAHNRRTTFSRISMGKPRRLGEGLPAVIQVGGLRGWSVFADDYRGRLHCP